jgi:hypothetical protein
VRAFQYRETLDGNTQDFGEEKNVGKQEKEDRHKENHST